MFEYRHGKSTSNVATRSCNVSLPSCACSALRRPNATELQYNVSYASIDMAISSRMRNNSRPRSVQLIVTCRMISSEQQRITDKQNVKQKKNINMDNSRLKKLSILAGA